MMTSPRFLAIGFAAQHGSRDEITHHIGFTLFTAETRAWLDRQLATLPDYYETDGNYITVVDQNPARDLANWGPKELYGLRDDEDDLPF